MTGFKVGDVVTGRWILGDMTLRGPIEEVDHTDPDMSYRVAGYWVNNTTVYADESTAARPLVGPAPKVEAPKYQAPFTSEGIRVVDDNGLTVCGIWGHAGRSAQDQREFAAYVAAALNARTLGKTA